MFYIKDNSIINGEKTAKLMEFNQIPKDKVFVCVIDDHFKLAKVPIIIVSERLFEFYKKAAYKRKRWYLLDKEVVKSNSDWKG